MTQDIRKPNDIFVSAIINPTANVSTLMFNGLNTENTGLLAPEVYRNSKFVQDAFKMGDGGFNEELFEKTYMYASQMYDQMAAVKSTKELSKFAQYNPRDIYAPFDSQKVKPSYSIQQIENPLRTSRGVKHLFGEGDQTKSWRELAQQSKVIDYETGEELDYTAEEQGFLGLKYLGRPTLVYATWDEDGTHFDEKIGREVQHKKGQPKLNKNGQYYCETLGNREIYGKQPVAYSDILTKEDAWLNKVDFFDSDGLDKSITGTTMKAIFEIAPYMIPYFNIYYGGVTAALSLAQVLPTFGKMLDGIANNDNDSAFGKAMTKWEGYASKFNPSYSDAANESFFSYEKVADMLSDVVGQLYQMRAAASLSKLSAMSYSKAEKDAIQRFSNQYMRTLQGMEAQGIKIDPNKVWQGMVNASPEMRAIMESQSKLSRGLSLGYMALISSNDVYQDALQGGYDRRTAGAAALLATLGQYLAMTKIDDSVSSWFLGVDEGYWRSINKATLKKALGPYYNEIAASIDKIATTPETIGKLSKFGELAKKTKNSIHNVLERTFDGAEPFWRGAVAESIEEVTEEATMDATKGMFDFLSWMGLGDNKGSFGGWSNVFSEQGAQRYLMAALGGFLGGAIFEFQNTKVEPWLTNRQVTPPTQYSLIHEIANGRINELIDVARSMAKYDSDIVSLPSVVDGQTVPIAENGSKTRGDYVVEGLVEYLRYLDSVINTEDIKNNDQELLKKVVRDAQIIPLIENSNIHKLVISDYNKHVANLVDLRSQLNSVPEGEANNVQQKYNEELKAIKEFLNGENYEKYLKYTLGYLIPEIRNNLVTMDLYSYTRAKYGVDYKSLPTEGATNTQASIKAEYEEWKDSEDVDTKFMWILQNAYDNLEQTFSGAIKDYIENYADLRKNVISKVLSGTRGNYTKLLQDGAYRAIISKLSSALSQGGKPGITLTDIFRADPAKISTKFVQQALGDNLIFSEVARVSNMDEAAARQSFEGLVADWLSAVPASEINDETVSRFILNSLSPYLDTLVDNYLSNPTPTQSISEYLSNVTGVDMVVDETSPDTIKSSLFSNLSNFIKSENPYTIEDTVYAQYFENNQVIDNELFKALKQLVYNSIRKKYPILQTQTYMQTITPTGDDAQWSLNSQDIDNFDIILRRGLDNKNSIDSIVQEFVDKVITDIESGKDIQAKTVLQYTPTFREFLINKIHSIINSPLTEEYNHAITSEIRTNPLYDRLRDLDFQLNNGNAVSIFNLLENESTHLSSLSSIEDYLRAPDIAEQLDNAQRVLNTLKAIVAGMDGTPISFTGHLFGYNSQIQAYLEKYGKPNADKYATISSENAAVLMQDINAIQDKLDFLLTLNNTNNANKLEEDKKTRERFTDVVLAQLQKDASKLKVGDISIYPPQDEIDKYTVPTRRLAFIEQYMSNKFREISLTPDFATANIVKLLDSLEFDRDQIIDNGLFSAGLHKDMNKLSEYDYLVYLTTILSVDPREFLFKYREIIDSDFDKVPYFSQEQANKVAYSMYADKLGIHNAVIDWLYDSTYPILKTKNIFFLNGVSGAGKTSVVARNVLAMINTERVAVVAPNVNQAQRLYSSVITNISENKVKLLNISNKEDLLRKFLTDEAYSKLMQSLQDPSSDESLLEKVQQRDGTYVWNFNASNEDFYRSPNEILNIPKTILIDEVTHFTSAELQVLSYIADKYGIKIFTFGDTLQDGAHIDIVPHNIDQVFRWSGPRLLQSIRPTNTNKKDNIDILRSVLADIYEKTGNLTGINAASVALEEAVSNNPLTIKYWEDDTDLHGDKLVEKITVSDIKKLANAARNKGKKLGILTSLDSSGNMSAELQALVNQAGLSPEEYTLYSPEKLGINAVQGAEEEYFIIDDLNLSNNLGDNLVKFYTFITRSLTGGIIKMDKNVRNTLHVISSQTPNTSQYRDPAASSVTTLKEDKLKELKEILGDYVPSITPNITPEKVVETSDDEIEDVLREDNGTDNSITNEDTSLPHPTKEVPYYYGYSFYNHVGLNYNPISREFTPATEAEQEERQHFPVDLDGLFNNQAVIPENIVQGFIKLKRILTLYPDSNSEAYKNAIRLDDGKILEFFKEIFPQLNTMADPIGWILENIKVDNQQYSWGYKMNSQIDSPIYKFGFDEKYLVGDGDPLLSFGRRIYSLDGRLNRFVTIGSYPKEDTILDFNRRNPDYSVDIEILREMQNEVANSETPVVWTTDNFEQGTPLRVVRSKNALEFSSLRAMINAGIVIKEIGLITDARDSNNKIKFAEFYKQYHNGNNSNLFDEEGNFKQKGNYYAIVSFTNDNNPANQTCIILDRGQLKLESALRKIIDKETKLRRGVYMSEYDQTQTVLRLLDAVDAFASPDIVYTYFEQLLAHIKNYAQTNPDKVATTLARLESFVAAKGASMDRYAVEQFLKGTSNIGIWFIRSFVKPQSDTLTFYDAKNTRYTDIREFKNTSTVFPAPIDIDNDTVRVNVYPEGAALDEIKGTYPINLSTPELYNYLGLRGFYVETPNFSLNLQALSDRIQVTDFPVENIIDEHRDQPTIEEHQEIEVTPPIDNPPVITADNSAEPIEGLDNTDNNDLPPVTEEPVGNTETVVTTDENVAIQPVVIERQEASSPREALTNIAQEFLNMDTNLNDMISQGYLMNQSENLDALIEALSNITSNIDEIGNYVTISSEGFFTLTYEGEQEETLRAIFDADSNLEIYCS